MKKIKVALLGVGTVGGGVYKLLQKQGKELVKKAGAEIELSRVLVRDRSKKRPGIHEELLTDCWEEILNDESIDIIIEVMGGIEPACTYITQALNAGKNVISANKDLMAVHGHELLQLAEEKQADLLFEAAVAGGIPIIRPLKQCLAGNNITEVMGIINGTTNFILTKMSREGLDYKEALAQATELGYAEADPTADVEGLDAGRKIAIMASIAFNSSVRFADVYTEGITKISSKDIYYVKELDCTIKLLGVAKNTPEGIEVKVQPMIISNNHPLAAVHDAFNAVFVHGDAVGDTMFYGLGAGEMPTASAVMGDLIDSVRNICYGCCGRIGCTCYKNLPVKKQEDAESKFFLRLKVEHRAGVLAGIASALGDQMVSISKVIQKFKSNNMAEVVVITEAITEKNFNRALALISEMPMIKEVSSVIRVHSEE